MILQTLLTRTCNDEYGVVHVCRVPGLVWRKVSNTAEVQAALREGARARATGATALNAASSRSHALVSVKVQGVRKGKGFTTMMHLVDLAGALAQHCMEQLAGGSEQACSGAGKHAQLCCTAVTLVLMVLAMNCQRRAASVLEQGSQH
jgi:hypothetical protein